MARLDTLLTRFFALSLAAHAAVFSYLSLLQYFKSPSRPQAPISVSLLAPQPSEAPATPAEPPTPATRIPESPAKVAKKEAPVLREESRQGREKAKATRAEGADRESARSAGIAAPERPREMPPAAMPAPAAPREPLPDANTLSDRQLPTVKELLPPITYSPSRGRGGAPVSLNTKDPTYLSYFNRIKQAINSQWEYPESAKRYGFQGKLLLEFTIIATGQVENLRLLRSSGYHVLDQEALRAIKSAAPFPPIPSWIKDSPLLITASMEYHDSRLEYQFTR